MFYLFYIYLIFILGIRGTIARTLETGTVEYKTVGEGAWAQLAFMMKGHYLNIEVTISKIFITFLKFSILENNLDNFLF